VYFQIFQALDDGFDVDLHILQTALTVYFHFLAQLCRIVVLVCDVSDASQGQMLLIDLVTDGHLVRLGFPTQMLLLLPLRRPRSYAHHWLNRWLVMHRCVEKGVVLWQVFAQHYLLLVGCNFTVIF